jgi:hypothetical protein
MVDEKKLLAIREEIVKAQELLTHINDGLKDIYMDEAGYIDCGCGCKIPSLETNAKVQARIAPPCCD